MMNNIKLNLLMFLFTKDDKTQIKRLLAPEISGDTISIWYIFAVFGNIIPVLIAFGTNLLINNPVNWLEYINNGAIPLIAYNIIISAIFYLQDSTKPTFEAIRKKVLGISILLLFFNVSLFILMTASKSILTNQGTIITFLCTLLFMYLAIKAGRMMVLLQKSIVEKGYGESFRETRSNVSQPPQNDEDDDTQY